MKRQQKHRNGLGWLAGAALLGGVMVAQPAQAQQPDPNHPGILEPVLTKLRGEVVRIPHTDQADGQTQLNIVGGKVTAVAATSTTSMMGHRITHVASPNDDMQAALDRLVRASSPNEGDRAKAEAAARDLIDILKGTTKGRIYDGFAMLNYNRGAFRPDHLAGEYKMKKLRDTGLTETGIDGQPRKIWEADLSLLYYDGQIDSDLFLLRVPVDAHKFDSFRLNVTIYSLVTEDFSPTLVLNDHKAPGSVNGIFKGFDAVWQQFNGGEVTKMTIQLPPLEFSRGIYNWGWRVHPPRIWFMQPVVEIVNQHTGAVELDPAGRSWAERNRTLDIAGIGDAAPEKKMLKVAEATLDKKTKLSTVHAWLTDPNQGPRGTWDQWADLAKNQQQLPPEAKDVLRAEGIPEGSFGPYKMVSVYLNNEMYGQGPDGSRIPGWQQGDQFQVKLINLDAHTHYFRNVDFGAKLHDDISNCCGSGSHSFEIASLKPTYGAPKAAEMQWRAGWGFRPHFDVIQQPEVFARPSDQAKLTKFFAGDGSEFTGYRYSAGYRGGDFRFNPPPFIIGSEEHPSQFRLREDDGSEGLIIGQLTEAYGNAKMCSNEEFPMGEFCRRDVSRFNPDGIKNVDTDGDGQADVLWFPPFLRNPNNAGGDLIPPTGAWVPFLFLNPANGTLFIDPNDHSKGFWVDKTFAHGRPVFAGSNITATVEQARASAQVFYQFDPLFHDNAIFSPHPSTSFEEAPQE